MDDLQKENERLKSSLVSLGELFQGVTLNDVNYATGLRKDLLIKLLANAAQSEEFSKWYEDKFLKYRINPREN